jgi:hypothetical protein
MGELWAVLGVLATIVLPMALAGWLLGRPDRRAGPPPPGPRGKMPADDPR